MNSLLHFPPTMFGFFISMVVFILIISLFLTKANNTYSLLYYLVLLTLFVTFIWALLIYPTKKHLLLAEHFIWDPFTALLSLNLLALSMLFFIYSKEEVLGFYINIDFYILCLLSVFGALVMLTAGSNITLYIGLEMMSLPLYGLVGLGAKHALQVEAAIKYIIMSIIASIFLLYGLCLLYLVNHHFSFNNILTAPSSSFSLIAQIGQGLLFFVLLFKLGAVPFHFWVPDVYEAASVPTSFFIATISKFATIGMGIRLFLVYLRQFGDEFQMLLMILGLISIIGGNLVALMQTQIRRLLAYSSISHMGFLVLGFALPVSDYGMVLFYGITYTFTIVILFGTISHLRQLGLPIQRIEDLKGLNQQYPMAAFILLVLVSSMAGIPPFIGFFSKFGILYSLVAKEFYVVGIIALLATIIGSYYYLNIIKLIYFEESKLADYNLTIQKGSFIQLILGASIFTFISLSIYPGILINTVEKSMEKVTTLSLKPINHSKPPTY